MKILHLEDNPADAALVEALVQKQDGACRITLVDNREDFLRAIWQGDHDVILSDFSLPGIDGMEALALARQHAPHVPFVFLSGSIGEDLAIEALRAGAADYVLKDRIKRLCTALQRARDEAEERRARHNAQQALSVSEANYRTLFEQAHDAVFTLAADGTITAANSAFEHITGWNQSQWLGQSFLPLVHPADRGRAEDLFQRTLRGERLPLFELRLDTAGGETKILEFTVALNRIADAECTLLGIGRDVTARKLAEARIRQQGEVIDRAPVAIVITDLSHRVTYCNQGAQRLYGFSAEDMLGRTADELFSAETMRQLSHGRKVTLATGSWQGEVPIRTPDGRQLVVEFSMNLIRDAQDVPCGRLSVGIDITEKKQLQEQFFRAQRMENLGLLAAGIAHDLNNILAPALMVTPILRTRLGSAADEKLLSLLERSTERGAALVRQILAFAHGTGSERIVLQSRHLVRDLGTMIEETFPRAISFTLEAPPDLWPLRANPTQLHQVLLNLCVNARDAMPNGGSLRLECQNTQLDAAEAAAIPDGRAGAYVRFSVGDSGTGIPPDVLARIWEPFFTTKGPAKGTGLGLSTVRGIVHSHDGFCTVKSQPGTGTTFAVYLPAAEGEADGDSATTAGSAPRGHGELILIVDDEAPVRDLIGATLLQHGYQTVCAQDGVEALASYTARAPEIRLVITDRGMPNLGGDILSQILHRTAPTLPILMITGVSDDRHAPLPGNGKLFTSLLQKPFRPDTLLRTVDSLLKEPVHPNGSMD